MKAELLGEEVEILRETIRANDGANVATGAFARKVENLIGAFYDDLGELSALRLSDILDLFLIKVLYVNRGSRDAETLSYLGRMLERYVVAGEMALGPRGGMIPYVSDLMEETANPSGAFNNNFEAYRKYGDNALFISGVYPTSIGRKRRGGMLGGAALVDRQYFVTVGKQYYGLAASQDLATRIQLRATLQRLSSFFDVYVDALNEMSGRYVLGMDMRLLADRMLDAFNRYRHGRDPADLDAARTYAALLKLDGQQWPELDELARNEPSYY